MTKVKFIAAAMSTAGLLMLATASAQADATSEINKCRSSSRAGVISCCENVIKKYGKRPLWMRRSGTSCRVSAVCVSTAGKGSKPAGAKLMVGAKKTYCYIKKDVPQEMEHQQPHVPEGRTPNRPTNG